MANSFIILKLSCLSNDVFLNMLRGRLKSMRIANRSGDKTSFFDKMKSLYQCYSSHNLPHYSTKSTSLNQARAALNQSIDHVFVVINPHHSGGC